jgi:hypothetical protein
MTMVFEHTLPSYHEGFSKPSRRRKGSLRRKKRSIMMVYSLPTESRLKHLLSVFHSANQLFTSKLKAERGGEKVSCQG